MQSTTANNNNNHNNNNNYNSHNSSTKINPENCDYNIEFSKRFEKFMREISGGAYHVENIGVENMPDKTTHSIIKYRNDTYSQSLRLIPDYRCIHKQDQNKSFNAELKTKKHPTFHDVYLEVDQLINNYVDMQHKFAPCLYCYWDVSLDVE